MVSVIYKWSTDILNLDVDTIVFLSDTDQDHFGTIEIKNKGHPKKCTFYCEYSDGKSLISLESFEECLGVLSKKELSSVAFPQLERGDRIRYENMIKVYASLVPNTKVYIVSPDGRDNDFYAKLISIISVMPYRELMIEMCLTAKTGQDLDLEKIKTTLDPYVSSWKYNTDNFNYDNSNLLEFTRTFLPKLRGWEEFFHQVLNNGYLSKISHYIKEQYKEKEIYPPLNLVYNSFYHTAPEDIDVLVIGQDPYHSRGQAMGIAFAVPPDMSPPPSLVNIYKEMRSDGIILSSKPDLAKLIKRKVCFINTAFTVTEGESGSHSEIWLEYFTPELMKYINEKNPGCVIIAWGKHAQSFADYFDTKKHYKIISAHPSPLSVHRGFFGSKPFSKANEYLIEMGKEPIDWSV